MIDNAFRRVLPRFVGPLVALYGRLGWTPNHVTALGFGIALAASAAVATGYGGWAVALWWISRLADGSDGIYARATGQESEFGGYLDILLDMAAYSAMLIGFAIANPALQAQWILMLFFYVLCITSALALGMQEAKLELPARDDRGLRLGAGLAEGGETGIAYSIFLLLPGFLLYTTSLWIAILFTTIVARSLLAHRVLRRDPPLGPLPVRPLGRPPLPRAGRSKSEIDHKAE